MLPGTSTGCPVCRYSGGRPSAPGPKARVAPLRWTHTLRGAPSTMWVSSLPILWQMSYTWTSCQPFTFPAESLLKGAPGGMCQQLPVGKGKIGGGTHRAQVGLPFRTVHRRTNQLPVGQINIVAPNHRLELLDIVRTDLVTQPARAAVDLHHQAALLQTENSRACWIQQRFHPVHFDEVIPGSDRSDLAATALLGTWLTLAGLAPSRQPPSSVRVDIRFGCVALFECPAAAFPQQALQFRRTSDR